MTDVDDADPCAALLEHERVQALHLLRPERRRRLVQEQDLRPGEQCLDHLEELPFRQRQRGDRRRRLYVEPELREPLGRPLLHAAVRRLQLAGDGEVEVLGNGEVADVRVVLIRHPEPEPPGLGGRAAPPLAASDLDGPLVRRDEAAGDPQQCRFPGPVLPDECVDLARVAVDADVAERLYRSERLGDAAHGEHGGGHREVTMPRARHTTVGECSWFSWEGAHGGNRLFPP